MDTTPREIWYWLTTGALEKLRVIMAAPFDAPVSFYWHVVVAGAVWLAAVSVALGYSLVQLEAMNQALMDRARAREEQGWTPRTATIVWQALGIGLVVGCLAAALAGPLAFLVGALIASVGWYHFGDQDWPRRAGRWCTARMKRGRS